MRFIGHLIEDIAVSQLTRHRGRGRYDQYFHMSILNCWCEWSDTYSLHHLGMVFSASLEQSARSSSWGQRPLVAYQKCSCPLALYRGGWQNLRQTYKTLKLCFRNQWLKQEGFSPRRWLNSVSSRCRERLWRLCWHHTKCLCWGSTILGCTSELENLYITYLNLCGWT